MEYTIDNDNCWQCNLVPGIPIVLQLIHFIPEKRNCLCERHYKLHLEPNPYLALVPKEE